MFVGADDLQVLELADELAKAADRIGASVERTNATVQTMDAAWVGPDAERFRGNWSARHQPSLGSIVDSLRNAEVELRRQAAEQQATSQDGASGRSGPVGLSGGSESRGAGRRLDGRPPLERRWTSDDHKAVQTLQTLLRRQAANGSGDDGDEILSTNDLKDLAKGTGKDAEAARHVLENERLRRALDLANDDGGDQDDRISLGDMRVFPDGFDAPKLVPLADAPGDTPYNHMVFDTDHNSYENDRPPFESLYQDGVRVFEIDIHNGGPNLAAAASDSPEVLIAEEHSDDFQVYHTSADPGSNYPTLSRGLGAIDSVATDDPVTVYIDLKDELHGDHNAALVDSIMKRELGDKAFTPADMMARAPGAATLQEAVEQAGWPTKDELNGRVIVVLTDNTDNYHSSDLENAQAFVAEKPTIHDPVGVEADKDVFDAKKNVIFYNQNEDNVSDGQIALIQANNNVVRSYPEAYGLPDTTGEGANHAAEDHH